MCFRGFSSNDRAKQKKNKKKEEGEGEGGRGGGCSLFGKTLKIISGTDST